MSSLVSALTPVSVPDVMTEEDKIKLDQRLNQLRREYLTRPKTFIPPEGMSEAEATQAAAMFAEESQRAINEMLTIIAKLRRTSAGPAKKGGKRAKAAPIDMGALLSSLMTKTG